MKMKQLMKYGFTFMLALAFANVAIAICPEQYDMLKPDHLYAADANGNVTDGETDLMWHSCPLGTTWNAGSCDGSAMQLTWHDALNAADTASAAFAGETGWRLPNKKELTSLMDKSCESPAINTAFFPASGIDRVWTSTVVIGDDERVWGANYSSGEDAQELKTATIYVYLLRDAP